ncbi:MAG: glycoside hydrolase family 99-like domain-containing protein [Phycisphaerae bacterium]|nr:glycoside hydrolase family 99-like domain-containing protein [Phycisphaerae bacterium]
MSRRLCSSLVLAFLTRIACGAPQAATVQEWGFDTEQILTVWQPNAHLSDVAVGKGIVSAHAAGSDPFFLCRDMTVPATATQYVVIRMRATEAGIAELFWSGLLEGRYGGLTEAKKLRFSIGGDNRWQEIVLFPFWHTEKTIRQLRLDLYDGARFEIDWIRILDRPSVPPSGVCVWGLGGDVSTWQVSPSAPELFAPGANIDVGDKPWVTLEVTSDKETVAAVLWAREDVAGLQSEEFPLRGDGKPHFYNIHMAENSAWRGRITAFGIRLPREANTRLNRIEIGAEPSGPGEIAVSYFGFENGVNRAGRPCRLLARVVNVGGSLQGIRQAHLNAPDGVRILSEPEKLSHPGIQHGDLARFAWEVMADRPGRYAVHLGFSGRGLLPSDQTAILEFTEAPSVAPERYVPAPKPVRTEIDVCAFYFPGWESDGKWDCIRKVAPIRKPLLGYYDESNPECVDWQIKWAVENGISCFLVDWYWVQGHQHLTHWFDAYRQARYRDSLKVAIMWANHNPPGTHSAEDWLKVARYWIERYFPLDGYYRIDGKPAVFIWNPQGIREDLGGSQAVREAFAKSKERARDAGFGGITLIAMGYDFSSSHIQALKDEGYFGVTTYHEWGSGIDGHVTAKLFQYDEVVTRSPAAWQRRNELADGLTYYPLVDTGWDSRPWHGGKAMVIEGRTPALFEDLLQRARTFCKNDGKGIVILGPVNEWGEGSYIEPCTEFGFEMLEAIRRTFATTPSHDWPVNLSPSDVGRGPYDFVVTPQDSQVP